MSNPNTVTVFLLLMDTVTVCLHPEPHIVHSVILSRVRHHASLLLVRVVQEGDVLQLLLHLLHILALSLILRSCRGSWGARHDHGAPLAGGQQLVQLQLARVVALETLRAGVVLHQQTAAALDVSARVHHQPRARGGGHVAAARTRDVMQRHRGRRHAGHSFTSSHIHCHWHLCKHVMSYNHIISIIYLCFMHFASHI